MKAVVTGATGFLGCALLSELVESGAQVCVICRPGSRRRARLDRFARAVTVAEADLRHPGSVEALEARGRHDVFYHLAWEGGRDDFDGQYPNVAATLECLRLAARLGCRRFVATGSQAEYGNVAGTITEATPLEPATAYGACKAAAYHLSRDLARRLGVEHTWVRVFSVYGPHDNPGTLVSKLTRELAAGRDFEMETDGSHIWNYLHESDAARALRLLGECAGSNAVFNLAGDECKPLREYAEALRMAVNPSAVVKYGNKKSPVSLDVAIDRKLRETTGWAPLARFGKKEEVA